MTDDSELLQRYARDHSQEAFSELVQRHVNFVYAVALRLTGRDAHAASDVTQYVFNQAARQAETLAQHRVLKGWLYTTAGNAAANLVRSERRRRNREEGSQIMHDIHTDPELDSQWAELRPALDGLLTHLDPRERDVLFLRFFEGQRYAEIGERLKLTADAARLRGERALEKMRAMLERRGLASSAAAMAAFLEHEAAAAAPVGLSAQIVTATLAHVTPLAATASFMTLSKLILGTTGAAAFGVLTFSLVAAHRENAALTDQISELKRTERELADQRAENVRVSKSLHEAEGEIGTLLAAAKALRVAQARPTKVATTPAPAPAASPEVVPDALYTILPGDTLVKISTALGLSAADVRALNPEIDWPRLRVGQQIRVK